MNKVVAVPVVFDGRPGYDIMVVDPTASVQDYLDALNGLIEQGLLWRSRNETIMECLGCDRCCQERIPLTVVDLAVWEEAGRAGYFPSDLLPGAKLNLGELLQNWCTVRVDGPVVDIMVRRDDLGRCHFLDPESRRCRIYAYRPLVCQTYICCPVSSRAERLREVIVNCGEDELVRQWLTWSKKQNLPLIIHEGEQPAVDPADWPATVFAGKRLYQEVNLRDLCPASLWAQLIR